jgi:predicted transposase/invertase (TIGR01784 family)
MTQERNFKPLEELNLCDDFLFGQVMLEPDICKEFLEIILQKEIACVKYSEKQKDVSIKYGGRGIRLDVYVKDEEEVIYSVEMQKVDRKDAPKRSRYIQSEIDVNSTPTGISDYNVLRTTYVIFICCFDPFTENKCIYTFENRCVENNDLTLGDGTVKMFLNTRGTNAVHPSVKAFLKYVEHSTDDTAQELEDVLVNHINSRVKQVKKDSKVKEEYMKLERYIDERVADAVSVELEKAKEKLEAEVKAEAEAKVKAEVEAKVKAEVKTEEMAKGLIETCKDFGASKEATLEKLIQKCKLPEGNAEEYLKKFW